MSNFNFFVEKEFETMLGRSQKNFCLLVTVKPSLKIAVKRRENFLISFFSMKPLSRTAATTSFQNNPPSFWKSSTQPAAIKLSFWFSELGWKYVGIGKFSPCSFFEQKILQAKKLWFPWVGARANNGQIKFLRDLWILWAEKLRMMIGQRNFENLVIVTVIKNANQVPLLVPFTALFPVLLEDTIWSKQGRPGPNLSTGVTKNESFFETQKPFRIIKFDDPPRYFSLKLGHQMKDQTFDIEVLIFFTWKTNQNRARITVKLTTRQVSTTPGPPLPKARQPRPLLLAYGYHCQLNNFLARRTFRQWDGGWSLAHEDKIKPVTQRWFGENHRFQQTLL